MQQEEQQGENVLPVVKQMIAVASGKGGVGKSTFSLLLALALQEEGAVVGLLDADIYGPSQPTLLGIEHAEPIVMHHHERWQPVERHGLQTMSMGYIIGMSAPMIWRGPMLSKAVQQLIYGTVWKGVDYLVIDLPPGTGDVQLTLCQKVPLSGALIVTTPEDLALSDVRRACASFEKLNIPMIGVIENMAAYHCSRCGGVESIFGSGGGERLAQEYKVPFLGSIPLDPTLRTILCAVDPRKALREQAHLFKVFQHVAQTIMSLER